MNKLREMLAKFMYGRYGTDRLNMFLLIVLIVCAGLNLFVRNGYFCIDAKDSTPDALVFNRIVSLKSSFRLPKK